MAYGKLFREGHSLTLQTTALVHEAYLRLVGFTLQWEGNAHFFAVAGEALRRILVERSRARNRGKRGGLMHGDLDETELHVEPCPNPYAQFFTAMRRL